MELNAPVLFKAKILNPTHGQRLSGLVLISQSTRRVNRIDQNCYEFRHEDFENLVIYTPVRWVKVEVEGPENSLFSQQSDISSNSESASLESGSETDDSTVATRLNSIYINPNEVLHSSHTSDDIAMVRAMGMNVDDDNEPVAENIPTTEESASSRVTGLKEGQSWGWNGMCDRKKEGLYQTKAKINGLSGVALENCSFATMFHIFFPKDIAWMIIVETNKRYALEGAPMDLGEFYRYLGLILLMSTMTCFDQRDFWSSDSVSIEAGAPFRFNH